MSLADQIKAEAIAIKARVNSKHILDLIAWKIGIINAAINDNLTYCCIQEFVAKFGIEFGDVLDWRRGESTPKLCYANSAKLAEEFSHNDRLIYCEGYATNPKIGGLPIQHAWCVNHNGIVFDVTTKNVTEYFGVPFKIEVVREHYRKQGCNVKNCSLLDNWQKGFPMLQKTEQEIRQLLHPSYGESK